MGSDTAKFIGEFLPHLTSLNIGTVKCFFDALFPCLLHYLMPKPFCQELCASTVGIPVVLAQINGDYRAIVDDIWGKGGADQ